jgi:hypothetical protein
MDECELLTNVSFQTSLLPVSVAVNELVPFVFTAWTGISACGAGAVETLVGVVGATTPPLASALPTSALQVPR